MFRPQLTGPPRLGPQAPAGNPTPSDAAIPFLWLDVQLSHFQHLGWRFRPYPDEDDQMIDYNDYSHNQDPRACSILHLKDHFKPWQEGGLLMVSLSWLKTGQSLKFRPMSGFHYRSHFFENHSHSERHSSWFTPLSTIRFACWEKLGASR